MIDLQTVSNFMYTHFEQVKSSKNGTHFLARCLLCGDSKISKYKKRFNLDYNNGKIGWHCFNCDRSGTFVQLYCLVKGVDEETAVRELYHNWDSFKERLNKVEEKIEEKIEVIEEMNWIRDDCINSHDEPDSIIGKQYQKKLLQFISDRKIPDDYKILIAYKGDFKGRIIIPIYDENDNILYFQGRRYPGTKIEPKYLNPPTPKTTLVMNSHLFDKTKPIVITEGIIDAFMLGKQGVPILGKEISSKFIDEVISRLLINNILESDIIIALDNDSEAKKTLSKFINESENRKRVKYFIYPPEFCTYKDINIIRVKTNIENLYDIVVKNSIDYLSAMLNKQKLLEEDKNENNSYWNGPGKHR